MEIPLDSSVSQPSLDKKKASQYWLTVALRGNPHWNEIRSSNSFWPELCCAMSCTWFMVGRVWRKANLPAPAVAAFIAAFINLPLLITESWLETLPPNTSVGKALIVLIVVAILCNAVSIGMVVYLRYKTREILGISGNVATDCCVTFPWICCLPFPFQGPALELASMDRALTPMNAPRRVTIPRTANGSAFGSQWGTTLWGCDAFNLNGDLPQYCCAWSCPTFYHVRLLYRIQVGSLLLFAALVALLVLPSAIVFLVSLGTITSDPQKSYDLRQTAWALWVMNPTMILTTVYIRGVIRKRYEIHGTVTDDLCVTFFCQPCVLAQMDRETVHEVAGIVSQIEEQDDNYGSTNNGKDNSSNGSTGMDKETITVTVNSGNNNNNYSSSSSISNSNNTGNSSNTGTTIKSTAFIDQIA